MDAKGKVDPTKNVKDLMLKLMEGVLSYRLRLEFTQM